jgi:CheY-like chemotaxis protein
VTTGSKGIQRILVADDEPQILSLLREALFQEGSLITLCRDGQAVLDALEKNTYNVVVCDLMMPRKTGFETVRELRGRGDDTPFVLMSSYIGEEVYEACKGFGRIVYLQKPFTLAELRSSVERATGKIRC